MNFDEIICIGNIFPHVSLPGRVYSVSGICANINTNGGGYHEPLILLNYEI